jgi:hypothetical protein
VSTWQRSTFPVNPWAKGVQALAAIPQHKTVQRVRFGWGASAIVSTRESALNVQRASVGFGLITAPDTVDFLTLPDPSDDGGDPAPPLSRFIWWEQRQLRCDAWDSAGGVSAWSTTQVQEIADSRSQVLANTSGTAALIVYAVFGSQTVWNFAGEGNIWCWASVLSD